MVHNLHVLFFLYRSKSNEKGTSPIFCRLTFDKKRKQFSTGHFAKETSWNSTTQRYRGSSTEAEHINKSLESIKAGLIESLHELTNERESILVDDVYNRFSGNDKIYQTLLQAFEYHNERMKELVGTEYVQATYDKFIVINGHIEAFIKHAYNVSDRPLSEIKLNFLYDLDHYLKVEKGLNQNTINKVIERVKKVLKVAVGYGWISSDPFLLYKKKKYIKEVVFLTANEMAKLEGYNFAQERLEVVRDCFIFSCYTGLAYNEASTLTAKDVQTDGEGNLWINMIRQKTQRRIEVLVLPKALYLLNKYGYPDNTDLLMPLISNQKFNSYLKEIAEIVGINKCLTHHIARKTFASTVLLNNDIPIEVVSFLLGHSKSSTTEQHYAKVAKENVIKHVKKLNSKLK